MALSKKIQDEFVTTKLKLGYKPLEIKTACESTMGMDEIPLSRIYTLSRNYQILKEDEAVAELAILPKEVIQHVVEETKSAIMMGDSVEKGKAMEMLDEVLTASEGLKKLDSDYQETLSEGLRVAKRMLSDPDVSLQDWRTIMDTVSKSHMDIFSSKTNIHIGDNNNKTEKLSVFQSSMGN